MFFSSTLFQTPQTVPHSGQADAHVPSAADGRVVGDDTALRLAGVASTEGQDWRTVDTRFGMQQQQQQVQVEVMGAAEGQGGQRMEV